jgi:LPXTG-motif cell wall-anchored protein
MDPARLNLSNPQAFASLSALDASGLLNLSLPSPDAWKVTSPGSSNVPVPLASIPVNFPGTAQALAGTSLPLGAGLLASGTINPVKIEAHSSASAVDSIVGTSIPDLSVLQGLLSIKGVNVAGVSTNASASASKGDTGIIGIDSVGVLSLGGLLGGLGVNSLTDLPLGTLTSLVDSLGLPVNSGTLGLGNLTGGGVLDILTGTNGLLSTLTGLVGIADCQGLINTVTGTTGLPLLGGLLNNGGLLGGLLGGLNLPIGGIGELLTACNVGNFASTLTSVTDTLEGVGGGLLDSLLGTLGSAPLLELSGVSLSAVANAADTLANSSATTSANFGTIKVGGQSLGALDLNATVAQVMALKDTVLGTLNTVTSILGLPNLIDIGILERTSSVKTEGAYNVASAGLDLLRVSINPPANLTGLLSGISATGPLSGLLGNLSLPIPAVAGLPLGTDVLANAFGLTSLLTQPTTIKVGSLGADADFTSVAGETLTQTPADGALGGGGTLPRTGTNGAWFAALAAISLAGAAGIARSLRKAPAHQGEDH